MKAFVRRSLSALSWVPLLCIQSLYRELQIFSVPVQTPIKQFHKWPRSRAALQLQGLGNPRYSKHSDHGFFSMLDEHTCYPLELLGISKYTDSGSSLKLTSFSGIFFSSHNHFFREASLQLSGSLFLLNMVKACRRPIPSQLDHSTRLEEGSTESAVHHYLPCAPGPGRTLDGCTN